MSYKPEVQKRAKALLEQGYKKNEICKKINLEFRVGLAASTIGRWATKGRWVPADYSHLVRMRILDKMEKRVTFLLAKSRKSERELRELDMLVDASLKYEIHPKERSEE